MPYFRDDIFAGLNGGSDDSNPNNCGLIYDLGPTGYNFNIYCTDDVAAELTRDVAIHAYIMGFRYEPDATGTGQFLAADASFGGSSINDFFK